MLIGQTMVGEVMSNKKISSFPDTLSIAREILAYLKEHPDAQDSIEGIMQWWLLERNISFQAKMLKEALAGLEKEGSVVEVICQSGSYYKLNKNRFMEEK